MKVSSASVSFFLLLASLEHATAFQPAAFGRATAASFVRAPALLLAAADDDDDETPAPKEPNPYQDENYPDLEFINYDDPEYKVDQGVGEEFFDSTTDDTEEQIEAMREDRRRRNDEFQFETYYDKILKSGDEYCGEWTIYKTSTFLNVDSSNVVAGEEAPNMIRAREPIKVKSRGYKITVDSDSEFRVDAERICHEELIVVDEDAVKPSKEVRFARKGI
jgi:hypothetical protein